MTDILTLALRLAAMDPPALRRLIVARSVSGRGIDDYFDLAERLLSENSIQGALSRLDRHTLAILGSACQATAGSGAPTVDDLALRLSAAPGDPLLTLDEIAQRVAQVADLLLIEEANSADTGAANSNPTRSAADVADPVSPYPQVCRQLSAVPSLGLPGPAQLTRTRESARDTELDDRLAAERAFTVTAAMTELLSELGREPARELARGGLALPERKRLAAALGVEPDEIPPLVQIARTANLMMLEASSWLVTEQGEAWLQTTTASRWAVLAEAWLQGLASDIRTVLTQTHAPVTTSALREYSAWLYPAAGPWMQERVTEFSHGADLLGITVDGAVSSPGTLLLAEQAAEGIAAMTRLFPDEVDRVYLQHDLTVVAPGPLVPAVDTRLRTMSEVESRAHASTYRISAASIQTAIAAGETAEGILEFMRGISLTGIPQPLEYLVFETAARHGLLRVGHSHGAAGVRSYVSSRDSALLGTLTVDRALSSLALVSVNAHGLHSKFERDIVFWALTDAKYPVAVEDENGTIVSVPRHRVVTGRTAPEPGQDPADALVQRLARNGNQTREQSMRAWLVRQLEASIRDKSTLVVSTQLANGQSVEYLLQPVSVFGGRLRGLDRAQDIERTLPISHIVHLAPAETFRAGH